MKRFNAFIGLIIIISVVLSSCKSLGSVSAGGAELKIGVKNIGGNFDPFYTDSKTDKSILNLVYPTILQPSSDNSLKNYCGGISYEFIGETQVKYTITIKDNIHFSDGKHVTIQDFISFIYLISDATYDGAYSEWYLNDIVGLKEYYFDDKNYLSSISGIEEVIASNYSVTTIKKDDYVDYLQATQLEGRFSGNLDSSAPSGETWRDYFKKFQYNEELESLGNNPSDEQVLNLAAKVEAEQNPLAYNPENWFREKLYREYIEKNYSNGITVNEITGIKKVNDYTCTILFNSRNINAVSQINMPLISSDFFSAQYIKGEGAKIKKIEGYPAGCGPYRVAECSDGEVTLMSNENYFEGSPEFTTLKFIDISNEEKAPSELVISGKIDVAADSATTQTISNLNSESVRYFVNDLDEYTSVYFNASTLSYQHRMALMGLCSLNTAVEKQIGSYFTGLKRPLSVRFNEYPSDITEPYYKVSAYTAYTLLNTDPIPELTACIINGSDYLQSVWLQEYKSILSSKGIKMNIISVSDKNELMSAIASGKADLWVDSVKDSSTCDSFERYNSMGSLNYAGFNSPDIDALTVQIRSALGLSDKTALTRELLDLVMEQAIECPIYQLQTVTIYNTETISEESFNSDFDYDGFIFEITSLKRNKR